MAPRLSEIFQITWLQRDRKKGADAAENLGFYALRSKNFGLNRNSGVPQAAPHRGRASFENRQNFREVGLHQCPSERKGEGAPVRSLRVPSQVPSHPQNAAKLRGFSLPAPGFAAETDWLLEESGFEPSVPAGDQRGPLGSGLQAEELRTLPKG
jgi:hypothetical protein